MAAIVGELREGPAPDQGEVAELPDGSLIVAGTTRLDDLRRRLGVALEDPDEHTTVAGFVIGGFGEIPVRGASLVRAGYRWTVLETDGPRVARIKVERQS